MITKKELQNANAIYIDPTDEQPNVHPQFFDMTAEEYGEQTTKHTMAILKMIDKLPNAELLTDEKRNWLVSGVMDKGVDLSEHVKIQDDGTIHILVDTSDEFSPETLAALYCNPWHLMPLARSFYSLRPVYQNDFTDSHSWDENKGFWIKKCESVHYGTAHDEITKLIKERVQAYLRNKEPKKKVKADYKAKFYKNTAKQPKPSPMLMSLVGKTKIHSPARGFSFAYS